MSNTINDLRTTLFETLQAVKSGGIELDRAKAICDISQTIINTAKAETDFAKATGAHVRSALIESGDPHRVAMTAPDRPSLVGQLAAANGGKR